MDFETLITIGKIASALISIVGAIRYLPKIYRWFRSWKILKQREFERLKTVEAQHQKCEVEKERLGKLDNPMAREIRAQLDRVGKSPG
jgi:tRNA A58 N-methylase Trm61